MFSSSAVYVDRSKEKNIVTGGSNDDGDDDGDDGVGDWDMVMVMRLGT